MMKKRIILWLMIVAMLVSAMPLTALAEGETPSPMACPENGKVMLKKDKQGQTLTNTGLFLHPNIKKRWNEETDYVTIEAMKDSDERITAFKKEHQDELYQRKYIEPEVNGYVIQIKHSRANNVGAFAVQVRSTGKVEDGYTIWPYQAKAYLKPVFKGQQPSDTSLEKTDISINEIKVDGRGGWTAYDLSVPVTSMQQVNSKYLKEGHYELYIYQGPVEDLPEDLLPGIYEVPVVARQGNMSGFNSMANGAIERMAKLIVKENGEKTLRVTFKPMGAPDGVPLPEGFESGHLEELYEYNSLDDYKNYWEKPGLYGNVKKSVPVFSTYTDHNIVFPKEVDIPLRNLEAEKMVAVKVDAMGPTHQDMSLLMEVSGLKALSYNFSPGQYRAGLIGSTSSKKYWNAEQKQWTKTKEEFQEALKNKEETDTLGISVSNPLHPWVTLDIHDGQVDATFDLVNAYTDSNGQHEYRLAPMKKENSIRYANAQGELKDIEILEQRTFTLSFDSDEEAGFDPEAERKDEAFITKFKLANIGFASQNQEELKDQIQLDNAAFVHVADGWRKDSAEMDWSTGNRKDTVEFPFPDFRRMTLESTFADFGPLRVLVDTAKAKEEALYTPESYQALKEAITAAEAFLSEHENDTATEQSLIDTEVTKLQQAIDGLQPKAPELNKAGLEALIQAARVIEQGHKTTAAYQALQQAITVAQSALNTAATQDELGMAKTALQQAMSTFIDSPNAGGSQEPEDPVVEAYKEGLKKTLTQAEALDTDDWKGSLANDLRRACFYGNQLLSLRKATQAQVDAADSLIQAVMAAGCAQDGPGTDLDATALPAGSYTVNAIVFQNHIQDFPSYADGISSAYQHHRSMMNNAVQKPLDLRVDGDGYTLQPCLLPMELQGLTGYVGWMKVEQDGHFVDINADSTYPVDDLGKKYGIEAYIKDAHFAIAKPTAQDARTMEHVQVFVPVMESLMTGGGTKEAKLVLYWDTLRDPAAVSNKGPLADALHEAATADLGQATPSQLKALERALYRAKQVLDKPQASDEDVRGAAESVTAAVARVGADDAAPAVDYRVLKNALTAASGADVTHKTEDSVRNFRAKKFEAEFVLDNPEATQVEINNAAKALYQAIADLKPEASPSPGGNSPSPGPGGQAPGGTGSQTAYVEMWHAYENKYSMGNNAIEHNMVIEQTGGQTTYKLVTKPMQMDWGGNRFTGHLTNLFVYDGGAGSAKREITGQNGVFTFTRQGAPEREIRVAVWVDAMDQIAGGGPGSGEQDAILRFTYNGTPGTPGTPDNPNQKPDTNKLQSRYDEARRVDVKDKPREQVRKLDDAIADAKAILDNPARYNQSQVDRAVSALDSAITLVTSKKDEGKVDKTKASVTYEVPVTIRHAYESGKMSMANNAVNHTAKVTEQGGKAYYTLTFHSMDLRGMTGNLTNLFVYNGSNKVEASKNGSEFTFTRDTVKENEIKIAVWVNAMDILAGGTEGSGAGEQDAYLVLDWSKAKETGKTDATATNHFTDVVNHWASQVISYVTQKGYFKGTSATTFSPEAAITRGQFVTVLGRMAGIQDNGASTGRFSDVRAGMYYAPHVSWAVANGIVNGYEDGTFGPDRALNREEMAVILARFAKVTNKTRPYKTDDVSFTDMAQMSSWAAFEIREMAKMDLVKGMPDGTFGPKGVFTRAQVAQVLYNLDH